MTSVFRAPAVIAWALVARDLKHHRKVALKVLKPEFAAVVGATRFLAEIETTANLQHPHILPPEGGGGVATRAPFALTNLG